MYEVYRVKIGRSGRIVSDPLFVLLAKDELVASRVAAFLNRHSIDDSFLFLYRKFNVNQ